MRIFDFQLAALARASEDEFERRVVGFVGREPTLAGRSTERESIRRQIASARALGLATESQVVVYVVGIVSFGDAFRTAVDGIRGMLVDPCVAPAEKTRRLLDVHRSVGAARRSSGGCA